MARISVIFAGTKSVALPWKRGITPEVHTFDGKRRGSIQILGNSRLILGSRSSLIRVQSMDLAYYHKVKESTCTLDRQPCRRNPGQIPYFVLICLFKDLRGGLTAEPWG